MATVEDRIVSMSFDNAKFQAAVTETINSLKKLNDSLAKTGTTTGFADIDKAASKVSLNGPMTALSKLQGAFGRVGVGASQGFSEIDKAGNKVELTQPISALNKVQSAVGNVGSTAPEAFGEIEKSGNHIDFSGITSALDGVTSKFSVLSGAAAVALGNIEAKAVAVGTNLVKDLAISPVAAGFHNYETQINAVQTIMANTGLSGKKGLGQVQQSLDELNKYANLTVYNFSEMAKNIGTFTAAGVDLKTATASIKGIANLAALSGSNSQQASTAMYQLSQAIASGKVGLQDWNSVVNAGMGGKVFQSALAQTAAAMGTLGKNSVKMVGPMKQLQINGSSFRQSIQAKPGTTSWLTSDVLTKTLQHFTGDMSNAQLKAQGFSDAQIKAIQTQAKAAVGAATNIKTLSQLMDALKEEVATAWGAIFKTIFGNIFDATKLFSKIHTIVENDLTIPIYNFNKVLQGWQQLGGRTILIDGLKKAFQDLGAIIKAVKSAFRDIFPPATARGLLSMTTGFRNLMERLKPTQSTIDNIQRTFRGLFAILDIGVAIVKGVVGVFAQLLGTAGKGAGGVLKFTGSLGDFLTSIDKVLVKGGALNKFFNGLTEVLQKPLHILGLVAHAIFNLFTGFAAGQAGSVTKGMDSVKNAAGPLGRALDKLKGAWDGFVGILKDAKNLVSPWLDKIGKDLSKIGDAIANAFKGGNFDKVMSVAQTAFIGGIFLAIKKAITGGATQLSASLGGLGKVFGQLTSNLQTMQQKIKAQIILEIAAAIGILAASAFVMAKIPPAALAKAMTAMAVGLGELMGSMKLITSGMGAAGFAKVPILAAGMILLASSMVIMGAAAKIFASMSWNQLIKGLAGVAGSLTAIGLGMKLLGPGTIVQAPAILVLAIGLNALALAVKQFASLNLGQLIKGLVGVFGALVALAMPIDLFGPELLLVAPALIAAGIAVRILASAVGAFGKMSFLKMAQGIAGMAAALGAIVLAVLTLPPTMALQAAGLVVMGAALVSIATAVAVFGKMDMVQLLKGMLGMGAALVVLGLGLIFMEGTLPGAAALVAAAAGLALLAPALGFLGTLKWGTIFKGLAAIALALGVLALAGTVAAPGIASLGAALLPLAGVLVVTAGAVWLFAQALQVMGGAGAKGVGVMVGAIVAFVAIMPKIAISFIKGLVETIGAAADMLPKVINALDKILTTIIAFVIREAPKLGLAIAALVTQFVNIMSVNSPKIIDAGMQLLVHFLTGVAKNITHITTLGADIVIRFLNALNTKMPDIVNSGARLIGSFLGGVASKIGGLAARGVSIAVHFIGGVISQIPKIIGLGGRFILAFLGGMVRNQLNIVTKGVDIILNFLSGVASQVPKVIQRGLHIARMFIRGVADGLVGLADTAATGIIHFLNGLATVIRKRGPELRKAGVNLASAIIDGMVSGFGMMGGLVKKAIETIAHHLPGWMQKVLGIHSPSTVFAEIGANVMRGLANGLDANGTHVEKVMTKQGARVTDAARKSMGNVSDILSGVTDVNPKITPVLDLSRVKKDAGQLSDITKAAPISVVATNSMAQVAALTHEKARVDRAHAETAAKSEKPSVIFEQHNTSPESLSTVEIYRRTNNQLSQIRRAVGL